MSKHEFAVCLCNGNKVTLMIDLLMEQVELASLTAILLIENCSETESLVHRTATAGSLEEQNCLGG